MLKDLEVHCGTVQICFVVSVNLLRGKNISCYSYKICVVVESSSSDSVTHNTEKGQVF